MTLLHRYVLGVVCSLTCAAGAAAQSWKLEQMVTRDGDGPVYHARPLDEQLLNPISADDERAFQARARHVIASQAQQKVAAGNTYFENEKRTYGWLMAQVIAGREGAIKDLQLEDAQKDEWHRETKGIDFYACFTLKHQTRKFFYFGDMLEPDYRQRMLDGAKAWSAVDPLKRPHFAFKQPGEGWGPDTKNSWVDVRSTENLYLMRVTSVYLFAEAAGNRDVAQQYKDEIRRYTAALYRVGIGEWDSENYHGHSVGPLCNLYDFARDVEVKRCAKACLDWFFAAGAVKYYRGGFSGPTKRDYNHPQPFGGSAANMLWLAFGDSPQHKAGEWESDEVHLITSAYRPPPAVMELARKNFERPVEIFASKPHYTASTTADVKSPPEYFETQYIGHSYLMGSLASGTSADGGDVNGFKILAYSDKRGASALQVVPGPDAEFPGSPQYQQGKVAGPNRVAQFSNVAIWLVKNGQSPWLWVLPQEIRVSEASGVTFLEGDRTWVAVRPLAVTSLKRDDSRTQKISAGEHPKFPDHQVLAGQGNGDKFCGLAIEVGEAQTHGSFAEFKKHVLAAEVDASKLNDGIVQYKSRDGKFLGFHWNDNPRDLGVWRNGKRHDWTEHAAHLYRTADATEPSGRINARWGGGVLYVAAGGQAFYSAVDEHGAVTFANGRPDEIKAKLPSP